MELRTNADKIKELKARIISNCKDAHWAEQQVTELLRLQKQDDEMNKLVDVPLADVKESIDFGACAIHKASSGFVFEAKGGLTAHVSWRMQSVCTMLQTLFDLHHKEDKSDDENTIYAALRDAVLYVFQAPIFASMDEESLYSIATAILKTFNEYAEERYENAEPAPETEEDIKENIQLERQAEFIQQLAEAPLPPEDTPTED